MKNRLKILLCIVLMFCSTVTVFATDDYYDSSQSKIYDDADLFSESEKNTLQTKIVNAAPQCKMDIIVVTTNYADGKSSMEYADDFYDNHKFGYEYEHGSGVLALLSCTDLMEPSTVAGVATE